MPDPNLIEVGDTVSVRAFEADAPQEAVVLSLPDNQLAYWRLRTPAPNLVLIYLSVNAAPLVRLVSKA